MIAKGFDRQIKGYAIFESILSITDLQIWWV